MRLQIFRTPREYKSSGHNLVSHFFTISFWFSEVEQKKPMSNGMGEVSPVPDMGRMGRCVQGFADVNFPFKLSHGLSSSGAFLGHQDV